MNEFFVNLNMDTLSIEILNPKATQLLQDMADKELIAIKGSPLKAFAEKIAAMKQAHADPLFLADVKEIADDFKAIDHEDI